MSEKICRYSQDALCTNKSCPLHNKTCVCNVVGSFGVCKYEELVDDIKTFSPVECLKKSFSEQGYCFVDISEFDINKAIESFLELMKISGHINDEKTNKGANESVAVTEGLSVSRSLIVDTLKWKFSHRERHGSVNQDVYVSNSDTLCAVFCEDEVNGTVYAYDEGKKTHANEEFYLDQELTREDVKGSAKWALKSFSGEPYNNACFYVSHDKKWGIRFKDGHNSGKVTPWLTQEEFIVGKQVHVGAIGESNEWVYVGEHNDMATYETRDKRLFVAFRRDSDWGTIMLNKNHEPISCGGLIEGDTVRMLDVMGNPQWHKVGTTHRARIESVTYESNDGKLEVSFNNECDIATIKRV